MEAKHLLETERVDKHSNPDIVGDERTLEKFLTQMASIRSQQTAEKTYQMQTLYGLKAVDNPMLSIGFNPFMGTPLEVLHTILLGLAKYMLKQFMPQMTNRMKEEVLARVNAFPHSGLHSKMFGNVCRYYNSFVGRDLKGWSQMSVCISSPYLSSDDRKVLLSFSKVFRIAYCNYFSPHLYHEWKSICENFVINVKHTMPELLNKPKVHLILHLVDCMVNLGPCSAFSAERCESFNATVWWWLKDIVFISYGATLCYDERTPWRQEHVSAWSTEETPCNMLFSILLAFPVLPLRICIVMIAQLQ
ncbi:hypothetical protein EMCRGX_G004605 [Ephydatia muelleri]